MKIIHDIIAIFHMLVRYQVHHVTIHTSWFIHYTNYIR